MGPDPIPAVAPARWLELAHSGHRLAAEVAIQALARLAVARGDWALADPLVDLERPSGLLQAAWAADVLNHPPAAERLLARALAGGPELVAMTLRTLERLGGTDLRDRLAREQPELLREASAIEVPSTEVAMLRGGATADLVVRLAKPTNAALEPFDRTGGDLPLLRAFSDLLGPDLLPPALVDALRRRDPDATAAGLESLADTPAPSLPADRRAEHASRLTLARAHAGLLRQTEPRREKFDRAASLALPHAVLTAALARGDSRAAVAGRLLAETPVWTIAAGCDAATADALSRIDPEGPPALAAALVDAACAWRLESLAPAVLRACAARTVSWVLDLQPLALRLEAPLLAALPDAATISEGEAALLTMLPSAAARAAELVDTARYGIRALQSVLACSFPTPALLDRSRRAPALSHAELTHRLAMLETLGARPAEIDPAGTLLHCRCGHTWNVAPAALASFGPLWPDPAVPCPGCGRAGDANGWSAPHAPAPPLRWVAPAFDPWSTPRDELDRLDLDANAVAAAELLELAGDSARADDVLAAVSEEGRRAYPDAMARILLRRGRVEEAFELCSATLADAGELLFADDALIADLRAALALAAARLGRPAPVPPTAPGPAGSTVPPLPRELGRNAPCPCGSGKKYKRCHGA